MPDTPPVIAAAQKFRAQLLARDQAALERLISAHVRSYNRLQDKVDLLIAQIGDEQPSRGQVLRMQRYRELMDQVKEELRDLQALTKAEMDAAGRAGVALGEEQARQLISYAATGDLGTLPGLNKLPVEAIEQVLGFLDPDGPLYTRLAQLAAVNAQNVADAVVTGISLGYNPRKVAAAVRKAFGGGLTDALRFTRTVSLWSYRESARASYIVNGVGEWVWSSALDARTCPVCLAMHGTIHPNTEPLRGHYNCRCSPIPLPEGYDNPVDELGPDWFDKQPEAVQRKILGPGKLKALREGKFALADVVGEHEDPSYGSMIIARTLKDLIGAN